jgi:predicted RNA binding protein YcfA (HicA-like mRNA interferase family)
MPGLRPLPYRKVEGALKKLGFTVVRQKGSHVIFAHSDGRRTIVPNHAREDIGVGLLRKIIRDVELDVEQFLALL